MNTFIVACLALSSVVVLAPAAQAQSPQRPPAAPIFCPEGTIGGKCVNPSVARAGRQSAIAFTQAQISVSEHPYSAALDTTYAYPYNVAGAPSFIQRETLLGALSYTQGPYYIRRRAH